MACEDAPMREAIHLVGALGLLGLACLACKGKGPSAESDGGAVTTSAMTSSTTTCTESTKSVTGSLHAVVAYDATLDPPKSKRQQAYECGTRTAVAYYLEYPTAADAQSACNFTGPQLWGGNAPTARDPDEVMTKGSTMAIVSGDAIDDLVGKLEKDGYVAWRPGKAATGAAASDPIAELGKALDCGASSHDPLRAWCPVVSEPTAGFTPPSGVVTYVGITIPVKAGTSAKSAAASVASVSALTIGSGRIQLQSVTPDNDGEKKELAATASAVAAVLRGDAHGAVKVGSGLAGFLDGLKRDIATKGHPVAASAKPASFTATNPSEVALVHGKPDAYVVVEHANDGTWLNVFPVGTYAP